jgi:DNA-binding beta-propeller fold protein YncE
MADGEDPFDAIACDTGEQPAECDQVFPQYIKVDSTPPHNSVLSGLPANNETGKGLYQVKAEAADGSGSTPSSGVKSLALSVDGKELGSAGGVNGYCSPGPCTASGEWTLNTTEYSPGIHKLRVTATDNAENFSSEEFSFTVSAATPVDVGPGAVEPSGGEFNLNSTDVSMSAPGASLTVGRNYESRHLTAGGMGPLGPQWGMSLSGQQSLRKLGNGSVTLTAGNGKQTTFAKAGKGAFTSPAGDENLVLSEVEKAGITEYYLLKNAAQGTLTKFTKPTGGNGELWTPSIQEGPVSTEEMTFAFQTVTVGESKITEPTEMLAPVPAGVSCSPTLNVGCRALTFKYASSTTATGENESEWKEYAGRLMQISLTAYNPATKAMQTTPVAEYAYDKQGRLRAEWDPRVSPALKTLYGYDAEGHVTALTRPGQQPWLLRYGAIVGDLGTGRLLSVTRPSAATGLWNGEALKNTAVPTLSSTSPAIGTTLSVASNGTWSNGPLTYAYQWEDCSGSQCTAIPGATNQSYTPQATDAGYTLVAQVSATNAGGSVATSSAASSVVAISAPKYSLAFGSSGTEAGKFKEPGRAAIDGGGNVWVTDNANNRIDEFSSSGAFIKTLGFGVSNGEPYFQTCTSSCRAGIAGSGNGQFNNPWGIAVNQSAGDVYVTDQGNFRVEELSTSGTFIRSFGSVGTGYGQFSWLAGVGIDANGNVWVADNGNNRVQEFTATGGLLRMVGSAGSGNGQFSGPASFAFLGGDVYVSDFGNKRIQKFSLYGEYLGQFASVGEGYEINENPATGEIYESDFAGKVDEFNQAGVLVGSFGAKGTGNGQFEKPTGLAVNASGDIYVVDDGNSRIQEWTPTYSTNNPVPEPPALGSSAVSTIEYHVPLSGSGLPTMTAGEVANWGQKDDPAEATAFFPPDEPQGWPAKDYKRASIYYLDSSDRTVNTAGPSGAISTSEYNSTNDVVRALSPLNRAAALKEGTKSAEVSKLLDSESTYNSEGTELLSTLGPEHKVKLASGAQVQARQDVHYSYDEGAPAEGGPYRLATKVTEAALTSGKEEEARTTTTSYSGQENLGWKLRRPTSATTDPGKLNLTHTTLYEPSTGNVIESRMPGGSSGISTGGYVYSTKATVAGLAPAALKAPGGVAVDPSGHVWVADTEDSRVEELSATGEYINHFGTEGTGNGQFKKPRGIAVDSEGNIWVADTGNNRVEELSSTGAFVRAFGSLGTEAGKFKSPATLTIDSSGNVWVADTGNNRVEEFSSAGTYLRVSEAGLFKSPEGIAADTKGDVWASSPGESVVIELSSTAKLTGVFGGKGTGNGQFKEPTGIAISGEDAYVVDRGNNRVQEFKLKTTSGEYLSQFGTSGSGNGQFKEPQGIALDKEGHAWVADAGNSRVQELSTAGVYVNYAHEPSALNGQVASRRIRRITCGSPTPKRAASMSFQRRRENTSIALARKGRAMGSSRNRGVSRWTRKGTFGLRTPATTAWRSCPRLGRSSGRLARKARKRGSSRNRLRSRSIRAATYGSPIPVTTGCRSSPPPARIFGGPPVDCSKNPKVSPLMRKAMCGSPIPSGPT